MIPFFPKQIASKAIYLYLAALGLVSIVFFQYAMSLTFVAIGVMWVVGFFLLSHYCSKEWQSIPEKLFIRRLFWTALLLRWAWVVFSYYFYIAKTGQPFEFAAADALWYYEESTGNRNTPIADVIRYLFVDAESVSDSGYVFYLSLVSKITGTSVLLPRFINSVFSAWTCVLLFQLTKRIVGEEAGRLAAVFSCFMPNLIYYCGLHMKEAMMLFVLVAFLERADYLLRSRKYTIWTILVPVLLLLILFTFRTVLGAAAAFAFVTGLVFTRASVVGRKKKVMIIAWGALAVLTLAGGVIVNEIQGVWEDRNTNQETKRLSQTQRGNQWAKYATGTVMAPMMFVLPFPTMVDVDEQYNQQVLSGGNYVRNVFGGFVLIALFSAIFRKKNWRDLSLIGSYVIAYLGIVSASGFANSERFLLPGLPVLLILAAYGVTLLNVKYYRFFKIWLIIVPMMIVGWAVFKLGSRGLL
ncbi:MAG: hypothetical protein IKM99_07610 [Bacteroidales bacterium]|nr:hypothetical protein [Bacteroidales bacterium]